MIDKEVLIRILNENFDDDAEILISTKKETVSVIKSIMWSKKHNGLVLSNHNHGHEEGTRKEDIYPALKAFIVPPEALDETQDSY